MVKAVALRLVVWPPLLLGLLNGWFWLQQPQMTFYPFAALEATPAEWGLPYEEVTLASSDGTRLHGWYLPHPKAAYTLLFFHGNGGNISHRGDTLAIFHRLGLNVFIIDYRGYGRSEGEPDEQGLYRDARAAWHHLVQQRQLAPQRVILFGRSLGGAVALDLATQVQPAGLILESTFSTAREMAAELFPLFSSLIVLRYDFNNSAKIARVHSPLLMLHSPQDEIIPYRLGRKLYAAAAAPKQFVELQGGHNDGFLRTQPGYEQALRRFIHTLQRPVSTSTDPVAG